MLIQCLIPRDSGTVLTFPIPRSRYTLIENQAGHLVTEVENLAHQQRLLSLPEYAEYDPEKADALLDQPRQRNDEDLAKAHPSSFSQPELESWARARNINPVDKKSIIYWGEQHLEMQFSDHALQPAVLLRMAALEEFEQNQVRHDAERKRQAEISELAEREGSGDATAISAKDAEAAAIRDAQKLAAGLEQTTEDELGDADVDRANEQRAAEGEQPLSEEVQADTDSASAAQPATVSTPSAPVHDAKPPEGAAPGVPGAGVKQRPAKRQK